MKKVLVPIDFSDNPNSLIKYAIGFCDQFKFKLIFFHSVSVLIPTTGEQVAYEVETELKVKEDLLMKKVIRSCEQLHIRPSTLQLDYQVRFGGNVIDDILRVAEAESVDLIIISTHGNSGFKKLLLGSTSSSIIRKGHFSVLAIPLNYRFKPIAELIYASYLKKPENELKQIISFARRLQIPVEIVNFNHGFLHTGRDVIDRIKISLPKYSEVKLDLEHTLAEEMKIYMRKKNNAVLCVFPKHKTFLEKLFEEGNTEQLLENLKFPLLSYEAPRVKHKILKRTKKQVP